MARRTSGTDPSPPAAETGPTRAPGRADSPARELTRTRRTPRPVQDTGRQHHLGAAPVEMPVLGPEGTAATTRVATVQLAARTDHELRVLADGIAAEMQTAAAALQFELAARLRDESRAVLAELTRRSGSTGAPPDLGSAAAEHARPKPAHPGPGPDAVAGVP